MNENKNHWYDGRFYDKLIAPNQDKSFRIVKNILEAGSTVIDIGCGTGRFSFSVFDKVKQIDAVDLSERNIKVANRKLAKHSAENIKFYHTDAQKFFSNKNTKYDYAVISYVIHEVDEERRVEILKSLSENANQVIIIDYLVPRPQNYWSLLNEAVEFAAGKDHYKNFKNYVKNGGVIGLSKLANLNVIKEIKNTPSTSHIVVLQK